VSVAANNLSFEGVRLHKSDPPIDPNTFYRQLNISTEEQFVSSNDRDFVNCTHV
jgi:hypothetical protein